MFNTQFIVPQIPYNDIYRKEALNNREHITLFTDRNMYAVNETIYFRSFYRETGEPTNEVWSKVLYVELVTPSGAAITQGKYFHDENGSSGKLTIPADALTGNYYLRCYTRWMRNFGPQCFCYVPIKIINPFNQDVLSESDKNPLAVANRHRMISSQVQFHTNKISYAPGEAVQLELTSFNHDISLPGEYCLTVVPAGLTDTLYMYTDTESLGMNGNFSFGYLPDIRGVSISGTVVNIEDQSPVSLARLHFSLLGDRSGYFATFTDDMGRFIVSVPDRIGTQELFVACEFPEYTKGEIRIEQDFSLDPVPFGTEPFALSLQEKNVATQMSVNMQLSRAYDLNKIKSDVPAQKYSSAPFYGIPEIIINTEKYIQLPTMTEIFKNLVPDVLVIYKRRKPYLEIESMNSNISLFPPLVLIDQIPVFDMKAILSANPSKIERIEVINDVYITGNVMIGGIIILTSKKGDIAAIDLPQGSYFFDYQIFHPGNLRNRYDFSSNWQPPDYDPLTTSIKDSTITGKIPDTRNTLLWIDKINIASGEKQIIQFHTSSRIGEYNILLRGVSSQGEVIYGVSTFTVEQ